ncbi:XRE family transcriptional regulator [Thermotomaculum hydrothermale]|uniref:XRE family transcriptional regulator n=1 Tax=Thermotomaculum hydrothermale TaxID=981385 RepID=A0A7R6SYD2_9BACT|nr:helix-turn-helix transcriptional regulator [Thermotomaculum hydrothermale]BBB32515.1 XRE family transcriptional regulator [Thermotomaculum hydrothermale]
MLKNKIKVFRAMYDLTQEDLAKKVGVSRQTINSIEKGKYVPSVVIALKMAKVFGVNVEEIFTLEEENNEENI